MGNALRYLCGKISEANAQDSYFPGPHGVPSASAGVSALARDIFHYEMTSQVPEGLSQYVVSSKKAQSNWYNKLLQAWKEANPLPRTPEDTASLVIETLKRHKKLDVEGLLAYYGLPLPNTIIQTPGALPLPNTIIQTPGVPSARPEGVKFELQSFPVDPKSVTDGDTINVYVDAGNPRESACVPLEIHEAVIQRAEARAIRNYVQADALQKEIVKAGYRVITGPNNKDILARKYRVRLRGIDTPETSMPYGKEAKEELLSIVNGKCVKVYVYGEDRYGRCVGDVHCNGLFVQELMLKKGFAWHYTAYDKRPELATWEKQARAARVGLWASANPEKPWEWRKNRRNGA